MLRSFHIHHHAMLGVSHISHFTLRSRLHNRSFVIHQLPNLYTDPVDKENNETRHCKKWAEGTILCLHVLQIVSASMATTSPARPLRCCASRWEDVGNFHRAREVSIDEGPCTRSTAAGVYETARMGLQCSFPVVDCLLILVLSHYGRSARVRIRAMLGADTRVR